MKAFLLAAGKGTRLQPLTYDVPKCLVPICGRPLIEYWFDLFDMYGIGDILINTSHLAERARDYIGKHSRDLRVKITYEESLLGSGGTIKKNWDFIKDEKLFFILYADNLTNINLRKMVRFHSERGRDFTLAIIPVSKPQECGIVEIDRFSSVLSFTEKPDNPVSDLAFAGIMLSTPSLFSAFPDSDVFDLGYDVLPGIVGNASGYVLKEDYLLDIGDADKLKQAEKDIRNGILNQARH
jgi:mannose-1-phosphate guanylyltransferase